MKVRSILHTLDIHRRRLDELNVLVYTDETLKQKLHPAELRHLQIQVMVMNVIIGNLYFFLKDHHPDAYIEPRYIKEQSQKIIEIFPEPLTYERTKSQIQ